MRQDLRIPLRQSLRRGLTELVGGASGPSISLSAPDFGGSTYYEGVDDNDITVTISNFEPSTSYTISVGSDGGGSPPANATGTTDGNGGASRVMDITGLSPGLVTFTAAAASDVKTRNATLEARAAPDAPTITSVTFENSQATVNITAGNPNGAVITDHDWEYNEDGGGWTPFAVGTSTATQQTTPTLTPGAPLQLRANSTNSINTGDYSEIFNTTVPAVFPTALRNMVLTAGDGQLGVAYDDPLDNGGATITSRVIQYRVQGSGGAFQTFSTDSTPGSGETITGLDVGETYEVQGYAVNSAGDGAILTPVVETTNDVPGVISTMTRTPGDGQVVLAHSDPANGGSAITDHGYRFSTDDTNFTDYSDSVSATPGATIGSLTNDQLYYFQHRARNANGWGPWSASFTATPANVTLLVDHDFSSDPGYILGGTANIGSGTLNTPAANDNARFLFTSTTGNDYRIQFDVSGLNGGTIVIYMGTWSSGTVGSVHTVSSDGAVDVTLTMHNNYAGFRVLKTATTGGAIDNLTVEDA